MAEIARGLGADRNTATKAKSSPLMKAKQAANFVDHLADVASAQNDEKPKKPEKTDKPEKPVKAKNAGSDPAKDKRNAAPTRQSSNASSAKENNGAQGPKANDQTKNVDDAASDIMEQHDARDARTSDEKTDDLHDSDETQSALEVDTAQTLPTQAKPEPQAADVKADTPMVAQSGAVGNGALAASSDSDNTSSGAVGDITSTPRQGRAMAHGKPQPDAAAPSDMPLDADDAKPIESVDQQSKNEEHPVSDNKTEHASRLAHSDNETASEKTSATSKTPESSSSNGSHSAADMSLGLTTNSSSPVSADAAKPHQFTPYHARSDTPASVPYAALPIEIGLRSLDGAREIAIDLAPKELGRVNIVLGLDAQSQAQVNFYVEQPQTLALLKQDAGHIRHALEQAGLTITDSSLQFSMQNDTSSQSGFSDRQRDAQPAKPFAAEQDALSRDAAAPLAYQRVHLNHLDLSV